MQRRIVTLICIASLVLGSAATVSQADPGGSSTAEESAASATPFPQSPEATLQQPPEANPSSSTTAPDAPVSLPEATQPVEPDPSLLTSRPEPSQGSMQGTVSETDLAGEVTPETDAAASDEEVPSARSAPLPSMSMHPTVRLDNAVQIGNGWTPDGIIFPGDWDGNGHQDLMRRTDSGDLLFYAATSSGSLNNPVKIGNGWNKAVDVLGGVDWNGDNHMDLVARNPDGALILYTGNSTGAITSTRQIGNGWQSFTQLTPMARSRNGQPALLAEQPDGTTKLYPTNGSASFLAPVTIATNHDRLTVTTGVGDWDANNYTDITAIDTDGNLRYLAVGTNATTLTHYKLGNGWNNMTALSTDQYNTTNAGLIALRNDGKLFRYPVTTVQKFSASTRSVTTSELGATWHSGCPVGASGLTAVAMTHWTPSGGIAQGTIIVDSDLANQTISTFRAAYNKKFPIAKMRPGATYGGDDVAMMADDNTSAFNCRQVVGNPYRVSPHSYGYAFDINPYKNPYYAAGRWYPTSRYATGRSASIPGMHMSTTVFPVEFKRRGGHWGACYSDYHHFELTRPRC